MSYARPTKNLLQRGNQPAGPMRRRAAAGPVGDASCPAAGSPCAVAGRRGRTRRRARHRLDGLRTDAGAGAYRLTPPAPNRTRLQTGRACVAASSAGETMCSSTYSDDFEAEPGDGVQAFRRAQHPHPPDAEVGEDLRPEPDGAQIGARVVLREHFAFIFAVVRIDSSDDFVRRLGKAAARRSLRFPPRRPGATHPDRPPASRRRLAVSRGASRGREPG